MTSFLPDGDGQPACPHGWQSGNARRSRRCPVPTFYGASGGTKWPMQPFWALGIPSLDALEECERVHNKPVPGKLRARKSTTPPGMLYPLAPRSNSDKETFTPDAGLGLSEMMAEHFARSIFFW